MVNRKSGKSQQEILLVKFGGTSVGSRKAMQQAAEIIDRQSRVWDAVVVVVSAMNGVTNNLIACTQAAVAGKTEKYASIISDLRVHHLDAIDVLADPDQKQELCAFLDKQIEMLGDFCSSIRVMGEVTPRGMDVISSLGERINAPIFSAYLREKGLDSQAVDATRLIRTDDTYQNARPIMDVTRQMTKDALFPLLEKGTIPVVTGFISANAQGDITTLGRGGSDYSASILADCLSAAEVWNMTDVDGVMTADPAIVEDARVIPSLTYDEMSEMSYFGAKVLHPKTILPIIEKNIPLRVKNTFNPSSPGTLINIHSSNIQGKITAITAIHGLCLITVHGRGMLGVPGIAARTFGAVAEQDASVLMISQSSSEQSICFVIPVETVPKVKKAIEQKLALELSRQDIDSIQVQNDVVIVTVIGAGMCKIPGVAARVFGALGKKQINVCAIAQGSSEFSISMVVDKQDADLAVRQLHKEVIINGN